MARKKKRTESQEKQIVKDIKRVNERRAEIERAVQNKQLPLVFLRNYEAAMRSAVHDNMLFTSKGNISHGKRAVSEINMRSLQALLKKETAGTAKQTTYKYYENYSKEMERLRRYRQEQEDYIPFVTPSAPEDEEPEEEPEDYTFEEFLADRDYVYENMQDDPDWYSAMKASFQGVGGKKSYRELRKAYESWDAPTPEEKQSRYAAAVAREQAAYFS